MPNTKIGKWSVVFGIAVVVSLLVQILFAAVIGGDSSVIEKNQFLTIFAYALSVIFSFANPLSFIIGLIAIFKYKDRSVWKPLAVLYGITLLLFLLGEFLFPH